MERPISRWLFALGILFFGVASMYFSVTNSRWSGDVREYWASGTLLVNHVNPYDEASVFLLERQAGQKIDRAQVMFNPPCALFFALPLGMFSVRNAILLWTLMILACLMLSTWALWDLHGRRKGHLLLSIYLFAPVIACVELGQIVALAMLGVVLFLWLQRDRPLLAGLCFVLLAVKPHLLLPFGAVVLVWAIKGERYRFMAGAVLGLAAVSGTVLFFDQKIFSQYIPVLRSANGVSQVMPNLSSLLHWFYPQSGYIQYLPAACAGCWAIVWYLRREKDWDWNNEGLLVIAVSVVVAPYSWVEDEMLMIPAVLNGIYLCSDSGRSMKGFIVLNGAALALVLFSVRFYSPLYMWTKVAWLAWVLLVRAASRVPEALGEEARL